MFSAKLNPLFNYWKKRLTFFFFFFFLFLNSFTITGVQSITALKLGDIIGPKTLLFVILFHNLRELIFFSLEGGGVFWVALLDFCFGFFFVVLFFLRQTVSH